MYAKEDRDLATIDIPNFFIQKLNGRKHGVYKTNIKTKEVLAYMLVQIDMEKYDPNTVHEK